MKCERCGKGLETDEISLYKKLFGIYAENTLCIDCQAEYFACDKEILEKKIVHFKNLGCTLFI